MAMFHIYILHLMTFLLIYLALQVEANMQDRTVNWPVSIVLKQQPMRNHEILKMTDWNILTTPNI